jgi:hypothetical protein
MKPTWCTPTCQGLSNSTKNVARDIVVWGSQHDKQTNCLPS